MMACFLFSTFLLFFIFFPPLQSLTEVSNRLKMSLRTIESLFRGGGGEGDGLLVFPVCLVVKDHSLTRLIEWTSRAARRHVKFMGRHLALMYCI